MIDFRIDWGRQTVIVWAPMGSQTSAYGLPAGRGVVLAVWLGVRRSPRMSRHDGENAHSGNSGGRDRPLACQYGECGNENQLLQRHQPLSGCARSWSGAFGLRQASNGRLCLASQPERWLGWNLTTRTAGGSKSTFGPCASVFSSGITSQFGRGLWPASWFVRTGLHDGWHVHALPTWWRSGDGRHPESRVGALDQTEFGRNVDLTNAILGVGFPPGCYETAVVQFGAQSHLSHDGIHSFLMGRCCCCTCYCNYIISQRARIMNKG